MQSPFRVFDVFNTDVRAYFSGKESFANTCFTFGTDSTWTGYDSSAPFGSADPAITEHGQFMYEFKFKADGAFIMSFGVAGNEQIPDVSNFYIVSDGGTYIGTFHWDSASSKYLGDDVDAATYLLTQSGQCVGFYGIEDLMIHNDFLTVGVKT